MTLLSVSALMVLMVAMLMVHGLERKTSRSYSDALRAELALESGLAAAIATLTDISRRDDSLVFRIDDPDNPRVHSEDRPLGYREQFFTYGAVFENEAWQVIPCFSNARRQTLGKFEIHAHELQTSLAEYGASAVPLIPLTEHEQSIPRAQWIEMPHNPEDATESIARFAFWIEDLSARIDGKHVAHEPRDLGIGTAELDASTLFDPLASRGKMPPVMDEKRYSLRTSASLRNMISKEEAKRIEPYIVYLPEVMKPKKLIPHGYGYADAGKQAPDLNSFVTAADVAGLSEHITRNLPSFWNRRGGFPASEDYVKTLAASIIDYADKDADPTSGKGYRGVDAYPYVNEIFDRYEWISSGDGSVKIKVETFVELWNPCQLSISGEIQFTNVNRHKIKIPPSGEHEFSSVDFPPLKISMPPNGFLVIPCGEQIHSFPQGAFMPAQLQFIETEQSNYSLKWNQREVDYARGGLQRTAGLLRAGTGERKWKGNASPAHDISIGQFGDPRSSIYINSPIVANSYDVNSNWGGRALKRGIASTKPTLPYAEVRINQWPDGGSSSLPGIRPVGDSRRPGISRIMNSNGTPYAGSEYPANQPDRAPAIISNTGRYASLCELGNIYDPAQWSDVDSRDSTSSSKAGGGFTLAIGRPEFLAFDTEGQRAAQLIDLFSIEPEQSQKHTKARRININTASREVLRCLVAGVTLNADPMAPDATPHFKEAVGDQFADRVIAHRNQSPLRGYSDLNLLRKHPLEAQNGTNPDDIPFFGNSEFYEQVPAVSDNDDPDDLVSWNDAGREELMRKVMDLVTFHSKTFRIVVAGEVISKSGKRLSHAAREFHFTVEPERDVDGNPLPNSTPKITKHYEISR